MRLHDQVSYRGVFTVTDTMPVGPIVEPTVVALRRFLSDHWQLSLADLRPPFGE